MGGNNGSHFWNGSKWETSNKESSDVGFILCETL